MEIGKHNRKLVELRKAIQAGALTADGLLPIEGPILLEEAHRSGVPIEDVFVRIGAAIPAVPAKEVHEVPPDIFKTIQDTEHSQGIIATVRLPYYSLDKIVASLPALIVVLARLQDPGNVGTILRISESFGASGCIALSGTVSFHNSKVVRGSAGSVFRIPHVTGLSLQKITEVLKSKGVAILGTSPRAESSIEQWDWGKPSAILVGNEGSGLSDEELEHCDALLRIPHRPTVESLNSAIATAVILYEASRRR